MSNDAPGEKPPGRSSPGIAAENSTSTPAGAGLEVRSPIGHAGEVPPAIPDHELIRWIGGGSYGEVWLARSVMGTYRAVKIIRRKSFATERPFEREFRGIQKFEPVSRSHESQVDILHIGRTADCFFYVMELADDAAGRSAREDGGWKMEDGKAPSTILDPQRYTPKTLKTEKDRRGRLPFEECLEIGLALTTALDHLHKHGLVHRDVKPSNVIFIDGIPKLADIGLVTDVDATVSFVGTEGFIPPEGPGTAQADIYSLGKVLYEICTGKDRQDFPEPPTLLGEFADREQVLELGEIIKKACAREVKARYASAEAIHADLLLLKTGRSVRRTHLLERRLKITRRIAVATAAVMVLGVVPYYLAIKNARLATTSEKAARREARKSQQVTRFLTDTLAGADPSVAQGLDTILLNIILSNTTQRLGIELTNEPEVEAEIRQVLGQTYAGLGQYSNALAQTSVALRLRRSALGPTNEVVADSLANIGAFLYELGDLPNSEKIGQEALTMRRMVLGNENAKVATSLNNIGNALWGQGKLPDAEDAHREALRIRRQVLPSDHLDIAKSLANLGIVAMLRADFEQAAGLFRDAVAQTAKVSDQHPMLAMLQQNVATGLAKVGEWEQAKAMHAKALALRRKIYPAGHRYIAGSLTQLAVARTALGELEEAESELREAQAMAEKLGVGEQAFVADTLIDLGMVLMKKGELADAETNCRRALEMRKKVKEPENLDVAEALDALALLRVAGGELEEAERMLEDGLEMTAKGIAADHPDLVQPLFHLAWVRRKQGNSAGAETLHTRALDISRQRGVGGARAWIDAASDLADVLRVKGRFAEAEQLLLEAAGLCGSEVVRKSSVHRHICQRAMQFYEAWDRQNGQGR